MIKTILMCEPNLFNVNYEINPWMKNKLNTVSSELALIQWETLRLNISQYANVVIMNRQSTAYPDIVFTANAGLVINNLFISSNFRYNERKSETPLFNTEYEKLGFQIDNMLNEININFEGAGDALFSHKHKALILGYGFRTDIESHYYIESKLKSLTGSYKTISLNLVNPSFYHLDTCFCPLDNGYILYYPQAFSIESNNLLIDTFGNDLISITEQDAINFACNAVSLGNIIIMNTISLDLCNYLEAIGLTVIQNEMSEFMKSGGSCKCLTININERIN